MENDRLKYYFILIYHLACYFWDKYIFEYNYHNISWWWIVMTILVEGHIKLIIYLDLIRYSIKNTSNCLSHLWDTKCKLPQINSFNPVLNTLTLKIIHCNSVPYVLSLLTSHIAKLKKDQKETKQQKRLSSSYSLHHRGSRPSSTYDFTKTWLWNQDFTSICAVMHLYRFSSLCFRFSFLQTF